MISRWLLGLLLVLPLLEILFFIQVGTWIGLFPTTLLWIANTGLGFYLLRIQSIHNSLQALLIPQDNLSPLESFLDAPWLLLAAILLITPGLLTDILGFLCLIPALRRILTQLLLKRYFFPTIHSAAHWEEAEPDTKSSASSAHQPRTFEGEYHRQPDHPSSRRQR